LQNNDTFLAFVMHSAFEQNPSLETVPATKFRSFDFKRFTKAKFDFIWHHHPEFELTYIIEGYGVRYVGSSIEPFHAGDFCLLGGDVPHAYGSHPQMRGKAKWLVLHFLPDRFGREFWRFPETLEFSNLLKASQRGIQFRGRGMEKCLRLLETLDKQSSGLLKLSAFLQGFDALNAIEYQKKLISEGTGESVRGNTDPRLQKVLTWMQSADLGAITQREAARLTRMSSATFSRFFRRQTGRTFVSHRNELRIARACVNLAVDNQSIAEIALETGFANLSNFNRRFKAIVGMSPRDYKASVPRDQVR
jgi:AraC-like DNA-binding protein